MTRALLQQALDALTTRDVRLHELAAEALCAELAKPEQVPGEEWFGQSNIESFHNACQHKNYCLQLKAQPAQEPTTAVSLQCANCQVTIEQLNDKVMSLMAQPAQEPLDIEDLAYSAYEEAMSFGLNRDVFVRYFKKIADHGIGGKA